VIQAQSLESLLIGCEQFYVHPAYHSQAVLHLPTPLEVIGPTARSEH
jgi:hypothetical protein